MKLFVGGLPTTLDEVDLKEMFELYGEVASAIVVKDKVSGKSKGFGFLDMPNDQEAKEAMDLLDGASIFGKKIGVKLQEEQPPKPRDTGAYSTAAPRPNRPPTRRRIF